MHEAAAAIQGVCLRGEEPVEAQAQGDVQVEDYDGPARKEQRRKDRHLPACFVPPDSSVVFAAAVHPCLRAAPFKRSLV